MKTSNMLLGILMNVFTLVFFQPAWGGDSVEEARAVFVQLVEAAKANDTEAFKSLVAADDLEEMEKEGFTEFMMMMMAEENPALYTGEENGDHIIFVLETKEKTPESSSTSKSTVHMRKINGQWKFGKPEP